MGKYNAPAPGSYVRIKSYLATYTTVGDVYIVSWNGRSVADCYLSNVTKDAGTSCRVWNFETCDWEYVYDHVEKPHLAWPRNYKKGIRS